MRMLNSFSTIVMACLTSRSLATIQCSALIQSNFLMGSDKRVLFQVAVPSQC